MTSKYHWDGFQSWGPCWWKHQDCGRSAVSHLVPYVDLGPALAIRRPSDHRWKTMWRSDSHAESRGDFQNWWGYHGNCAAHSLSYPRQHLLVDGRWQGSGGIYRGYSFHRRWVIPSLSFIFELTARRVWPFLRRHGGRNAQSSEWDVGRVARWYESLRTSRVSCCYTWMEFNLLNYFSPAMNIPNPMSNFWPQFPTMKQSRTSNRLWQRMRKPRASLLLGMKRWWSRGAEHSVIIHWHDSRNIMSSWWSR